MEETKTYLTTLITGILDRHLPIVDSISSLLDPDPVKAAAVISRLIYRTVQQFCYYLPMTFDIRKSISGTEYTFIDNYLLYAKNEISIQELELIPDAIAKVGFGGGNWEITGNYYEYNRPILRIGDGYYLIRAVCQYPIYIDYDQNGLLTNKSHIFGLSKDIMNQFENMLDLTFLTAIRSRAKLIELPLNGASFINLDTTIELLNTAVDDDRSAASTLGLAWL